MRTAPLHLIAFSAHINEFHLIAGPGGERALMPRQGEIWFSGSSNLNFSGLVKPHRLKLFLHWKPSV